MDKKTVKKHVEESLECRSNEQESNENTNEHSDSTGPGETLSHLLFEESSETMAPERWENSAATCLTSTLSDRFVSAKEHEVIENPHTDVFTQK